MYLGIGTTAILVVLLSSPFAPRGAAELRSTALDLLLMPADTTWTPPPRHVKFL